MSSNAIAGDKIASLPASGVAVWKAHLAALAVILLALGAAMFADINAAWNVWWFYPAYSHCYLIIPISAWLIWEKRASVFADTPGRKPGGAGAGDSVYRALAGRPVRLHHRIPAICAGRTGGGLHRRSAGLAHLPSHFLRLPLSFLPGSHRPVSHPPAAGDHGEIRRASGFSCLA